MATRLMTATGETVEESIGNESGWLEIAAHGLQRVIRPVSMNLVYIGAAFVLAMAIIVVIDILLRLLFNRPINGVIELETFMLAVVCFLALGYSMFQGSHVSVDLFYRGYKIKCVNDRYLR